MPQDGARAMQQLPFGSGMGPGNAMPPGPGGMPQGQQPILNVSTFSASTDGDFPPMA